MNFTKPHLLKLIESIRSESAGEGEKCVISKLAVDSTNSVRLPCNHCVHIDFFASVRKKQKCAYCGRVFNIQLIERPCVVSSCCSLTPIQNERCKQHNRPLCTFILTRGKNKGHPCRKKCSKHGMCEFHFGREQASDARESAL